MEKTPLLEVKNLRIAFDQYSGRFSKNNLGMIRDLSVMVREGELVAVVGPSGSGKSLLAHGILGILPDNAEIEGEIRFRGTTMTQRCKESLRGNEIALVPQNLSYLDPLLRMGPQLRKGKRDAKSRQKTREILAHYSLNEQMERMYPFELSGGMTRRILISTALIDSPSLVIADEPTPGLDEKLARRVMSHFRAIADDGAGILLITHDLELALEVADRISVIYAGTSIEDAAATDFLHEETLRHPYTRALWRAMPRNGFRVENTAQPCVAKIPAGCPFQQHCAAASGACRREIPYRRAGEGFVRCIHTEEAVAAT